ncbi:MAG: hypothetical protein ACKN9E_11965, partial [Microcystaceae cyanobacterium]
MTQSTLNPELLKRQLPLGEPEEEEEEDYFDYFYDEPGSEPGTLSIEPDAQPSCGRSAASPTPSATRSPEAADPSEN